MASVNIKLVQYTINTIKQAKHLINVTFAYRILKIKDIISVSYDVKQESEPDEDELMKCSESVKAAIESASPIFNTALQDWHLLNMALEFMQSTDASGATAKQELCTRVSAAEQVAYEFLRQFPLYHLSRAEVVVKRQKFPQVKDFAEALQKMDKVQLMSVSSFLKQLLHHYCDIHAAAVFAFPKLTP